MRRIAIINQKGGVGKTTSTVNIGAALARAGLRVLMIDLDPQGHLSLHLGVNPAECRVGTYQLLAGSATIDQARTQVADNLWVVGSSIDLAGAEVELVSVVGREVILRDLLEQHASGSRDSGLGTREQGNGNRDAGFGIREALQAQNPSPESRTPSPDSPYDYVLMDCPPSLSVLTLNGLCAAKEVIIPLQPHYLALQGLGKLLETVSLVSQRINRDLMVTGVVICMREAGTRLGAEVVEDVRSFLESARTTPTPWRSARLYDTQIRRNIKLAEAPSYGQSIFDYAADSNGACDYEVLASEIHDPTGSLLAKPMGAELVEAEAPANLAIAEAPAAIDPLALPAAASIELAPQRPSMEPGEPVFHLPAPPSQAPIAAVG